MTTPQVKEICMHLLPDLLPNNACHLVSIQLDNRIFHDDLPVGKFCSDRWFSVSAHAGERLERSNKKVGRPNHIQTPGTTLTYSRACSKPADEGTHCGRYASKPAPREQMASPHGVRMVCSAQVVNTWSCST